MNGNKSITCGVSSVFFLETKSNTQKDTARCNVTGGKKIKKIIIVLSEQIALCNLLRQRLEPAYEIIRYGAGEWEKKILEYKEKDVALFVVERMQNFQEALQAVKKIRLYSFTGVLLLVSDTEEPGQQGEEKISSIEAGADEYIGGFQSNAEIKASVKAWLRRCDWKGAYSITINDNQIWVNPQSRKLRMEGEEIPLTKKEFDILYYLLLHLNKAVSYKELYEAVWGKEYLHDELNIMAHIHRIRNKIGEAVQNPLSIQNVHGMGYRIEGGDLRSLKLM